MKNIKNPLFLFGFGCVFHGFCYENGKNGSPVDPSAYLSGLLIFEKNGQNEWEVFTF